MKKDEKYETLKKLAKVCKCGHSITIWNKKGYIVCDWCGRLVFANEKIEKEYRQKETLYKLKKELLKK